MLNNLGGPHLIIILFIIILLFGAPKLPALARSLGQSMKIFRSEVSTKRDANAEGEQGSTTTPSNEASTSSNGAATSEATPPAEPRRDTTQPNA